MTKTMLWENLKDYKCPFCSDRLFETEDALEYECVSCYFHIDKHRFKSIAKHRAQPRSADRPYKRNYWQNLRNGRCPTCNNLLRQAVGPYEIMECYAEDCTFKMREDRIQIILNDPNHSCNRYVK